MSITSKTKSEVAAALKRIQYKKVAEAINKKHLNSALRTIPKFTFSRAPNQAVACCVNVGQGEGLVFRKKIGGSYRPHLSCHVRAKHIILDVVALAEGMIREKGKMPVTAIVTHELIHAIQAQNGYSCKHNLAFEKCSAFACHSGLRVDGGLKTYVPKYGKRVIYERGLKEFFRIDECELTSKAQLDLLTPAVLKRRPSMTTIKIEHHEFLKNLKSS